ncbi:MAG: MinD/ParA family protein [Steroidobacteraceae bacterium]
MSFPDSHPGRERSVGRRPGGSPVQVIAVTGGKGGVGKSTVSINLAAAFAQRGRRTLLLDGDLGLANADVLLGLTPRYTLAHVIRGERTLQEILVEAPQGFSVVPAASGIAQMAALGAAEHLGLVRELASVGADLETLVVDTPAGIAPGVLQLAQAAQHVLVVVCDEPTSITDAYALIKVLQRDHAIGKFRVLANMVRDRGQGRRLFDTLNRVTARFLDVTLEYAGEVPEDPWLRRSVREQRPVVDGYPASPSARALQTLAASADAWPRPAGARGNIEFFAERLVRRPPPVLEVVR